MSAEHFQLIGLRVVYPKKMAKIREISIYFDHF